MSLGYLYDSSGSFKSAIQYYKSVLKTDPDYPDIWNNLGISYYNDGQIKNSISYFHKAIQLNLTFAYPVNNLGFIYIQKDDFSNAKKYFLRSIGLKPSEPFLLGETYTDLSICDYHLSEWNTVKENKKDQSNLTSIFLEGLFEKGIKVEGEDYRCFLKSN